LLISAAKVAFADEWKCYLFLAAFADQYSEGSAAFAAPFEISGVKIDLRARTLHRSRVKYAFAFQASTC
jgi:hypothetical protein